MGAGRRIGGAAAALVLAVLPLTAAGATEDEVESESPLEIEVDRPVVTAGDPIELEIEYELELPDAEDDAEVEGGGTEGEDPAGTTDDGTAPEAGIVAASDADPDEGSDEDSAVDEVAADGPVVTFTVDFGDGSEVETHDVTSEANEDEIEAELELEHVYEAEAADETVAAAEADTDGGYTITVTATPEGGTTEEAATTVVVTDELVPYPRSGDDVCPELDEDADTTTEGEAATDPAPADETDVAAAGRPDWAGTGAGPFVDVDERSPHGRFISCLAHLGLIQGDGASQYAPGRSVTREQLATLLVRAIERSGTELPVGDDDAFDDIEGSVHADSINALAAAGLVSGTADGTFRPTAPVTRAQMATFLTSVYERIVDQRLATNADYFADDDGTTHEGSINRAAAAGFAAGTGGRSFAPGRDVSREQIATFVGRMLDAVATESGTV